MRFRDLMGLPHTMIEGSADVPSRPLGHRWGRFSLPGWLGGVSAASSACGGG